MSSSQGFPENDYESPPNVSGMSRVRIGVSAMLALAAAIAYLCRNSIAVAEKTIREDLNLSEDAMGVILGPAFFWTYALAQIPGAWLGRRIGSRRVLPLFLAISSAATALIGLARIPAMLIIGRVATGVAQAGQFPCSAGTISVWHPKSERALASGVLGAAMSVGAAIGAALTGELLGFWSWRTIYLLYAVPGVLWAVWFYVWFRNHPGQHESVSSSELSLIQDAGDMLEEGDPSEPTPWLAMLSSSAMWMICGQQFFRAAGYAFFGSWFATWLQETRGVTIAKSGWLLMLPLLATVAGSISGGALSDWIFRRTGSAVLSRKLVATVSLSLCSILVFSAWSVADATLATVVISIGVYCASAGGPCAYAVTIDVGGQHVRSTFAVMNMIGNFGAGLLPLVVPSFKRLIEGSETLLRVSGGDSWNAVLVLFGLTYVLAATCWGLLNTQGAIFDRPD